MKRYKHNLSHYKVVTGDGGILYPISHYEVLPGDTVQQQSSALVRCSPLLAPVMHRFHVRVHTFYLPFRILHDDWEDFITGKNPAATLPKLDLKTKNWGDGAGIVAEGTLPDYLGIPPGNYSTAAAEDVSVNAWPLHAYNRIWNEYYRDQDLAAEITDISPWLQRVSWGKDYFTAARPWPQKGTAVSIPLGDSAPVTGIGIATGSSFAQTNPNVYETDGSGSTTYAKGAVSSAPAEHFLIEEDPNNLGFPNIRTDLTGATASDVRDVRVAFALQRYEEARAMYGSRYTEYLRYLGVRSSDARLQRPEYLGGGKRDISFSEVLQTAEGTDPVGAMKGHGISGMATRPFRKFFEEHGIVMSVMSIRPQSIYSNGLHRSWLRETKEDYFQKELQFVGQQEIKNGEVYFSNDSLNYDTFGYGDRYSEYTHHPSTIAGDFRSTLDFWTAARSFTSRPALNTTFTNCDPTDRIFAVPSEHTFWVASQQKIIARRMVQSDPTARIL